MFDDDDRDDSAPQEQDPGAEAPEAAEAEQEAPAAEEAPAAGEGEAPAAEEGDAPTAEEETPAGDEAPADEEEPTSAEEPAPAEEPGPRRGGPAVVEEGPGRPKRERKKADKAEPEVIPGAHLEPDLVLEEETGAEVAGVGEQTAAQIQAAEEALEAEGGEPSQAGAEAPAAVPTTILDLAADARYQATGKRKRAVARVILRPGSGTYTVNGRQLDQFFPRPVLQKMARGPLETVGQQERMDVVAKIHGGGVSSQAGALRHGIARALVEADPALRGELKRRGFLTRDPRVKERKKAGLKKARKRPQFSKR